MDNLLAAPRALMRLELKNIEFHAVPCTSPGPRTWYTATRNLAAAYANTLADGGVEQLLTTLSPFQPGCGIEGLR
ncbi:hypothetical protein [Streptomyces sp. NBC_00459]|uniref:hypothetical protein n=1 Tax=Streptomyces sp. NBC_00459 TaxID=2975749 RepID=UPI002E188740